jgi:hypothetical protein
MARANREDVGKVDLPKDTGEGEDLGDFTGVDDAAEHEDARELEDLDFLCSVVDTGRPASEQSEHAKRLEAKGFLAPKSGEPGLWPTKKGDLAVAKRVRRHG